jgi:hypothetical protein
VNYSASWFGQSTKAIRTTALRAASSAARIIPKASSAASVVHNPPLLERAEIGEIQTGYGLDDRGIGLRNPAVSRIFSSSRRPDRL